MKVIKKTKERILSVILTFVMVLSSMAGLAPMEVNAEIASTATLKYEVVGGSGTMDSEPLNVGEVFTVPEPTFEPEDHLFYGWIVEDENGDLVARGYSNPEFTVQEGKTYTATAYYGYPLTVKNLPDGASVMTMCEAALGNPNAVVVPGFAGSAKEEGNMFVIASDSMDSVPTLKVENARAYCIGASEGQYMFFLRYITGPVTVTLMDAPEVSGNIELKENVTITKLDANKYEVQGLAEEDGFTWVYDLCTVGDGVNVNEKVAYELNGWLSCEKGKYVERKKVWGVDDEPFIMSGSYKDSSYQDIPIDEYHYVQIFKLDAAGNVHEVALLPLPKGGAPEATECTVTLQFDESMLKDVELLSIDAEGTSIVGRTSENGGTVTMPAGGRIQVSSSGYFSVTVEDTGAQPGEISRGYGVYRCGIQNITKDTTVVVNKEAAPGVAPTVSECSVTNNQERGYLFISNNTDKVVYCKIMDENGNKFTDWFQIEGGKYGNISTSRFYSGTYYVYTCFADYYDGYGEPEEHLVCKIPFTIAPPVPPTAEDVSIDTSHPGVLHFKKLNNKKIYSKVTDTEGNVIKKWSADLCYVPVDMTTSFGPLEAGEYIVHLCYETAYREEDTEEAAIAQFPVTVTGADLKEGYLDTEKKEYIIDYKDGEKVIVAIAKNHLTGGEGIAKYYTQDDINWYKLPDDEQVRIVVTNSDPSVSPKSFIGYFESTERLGEELGADYLYEFDFNVTFRDVSIEDPEETDEAVHFGGGDIKLTIDGNVYVEDLYNWDKLEVLGEGKNDTLTAGHVNLRNGYVGLEIRDLKKFAIKDRGDKTGSICVTYGAATFSNIDEMTVPENGREIYAGEGITFRNVKKFTLLTDDFGVRTDGGKNIIFENSFGTITSSSDYYDSVFTNRNNIYVILSEETEIKTGLNAETATAITVNEDNSINADDCGKYFEIVGEYVDPTPAAPVITSHPADVTVSEGETATFSVTATGDDLQYQWKLNGTDISGATSASYTTAATTAADDGNKYQCVVTNAGGTVTSETATLTVKVSDSTSTEKIRSLADLVRVQNNVEGNYTITFDLDSSKKYVISKATAEQFYDPSLFNATYGPAHEAVIDCVGDDVLSKSEFTQEAIKKYYQNPSASVMHFTGATNGLVSSYGPITVEDGTYVVIYEVKEEDAVTYVDNDGFSPDNSGEYYIIYAAHAVFFPTDESGSGGGENPTPSGYTITFDNTNYSENDCFVSGRDSVNEKFWLRNYGDQAIVDANGTITIEASNPFTVTAEGATIGELREIGDSGYQMTISNFTKDTTIVVTKINNDPEPPVHTHTLTEVPAKAATCTEAGNNKYYECACGKFFKDADGTTETTVETETIAASHSWVTDAWEKDATNHWHKCNNCTDVKDSAAHTNANGDNACDTCGYVKQAVVSAPTITVQPQNTSVQEGETATFSVSANGEGLSYQWQVSKNNGADFENISGATNATYTTTEVDMSNNGYQYQCIVSNDGGSVTTTPVTLTVTSKNETDGGFETDAEVTPDSPIKIVKLNNTKEELLAAEGLFTDAEKNEIEEGASVRVWLEVSKTDISTIAPEDQDKMEQEAIKQVGNNPVITYFDAELFKQVNEAVTTVSEPGMMIKVAIRIPEEILNKDTTKVRDYKILRLHEGEVSVIEGIFNAATGEFTFETDKFSTYAIVYSDKNQTVAVESVKINVPATTTLTKAGESVQLTAVVTPADATDKSVTWSSSNTEVATVDANGKVIAVGNGTAVITVKTTDGDKTDSVTVTVAIASSGDEPGETPDEPGETPDQPGETPDEPGETPDQPGETPEQPGETPDQPGETPDQPVVKPDQPVVKPDKPAVTPDKPAEIAPEAVEKNELKINEGLKVDQKGSTIKAKWGKVSNADGYKVYVQYCGKSFSKTPNAVIKGAKNNSVTIKKINGKKLDLKKNYKFYVVAYKIVNGEEVELGRSITAHIVGRKNNERTNVKKVKVKKSKYTLKVNKTATIKASTVLVDKNKKQLTNAHAKEFRYATSDESVATVSAKGKIKAVGKGKCTIYVYARNGYCKKVSVTVK